ncbi:uncharacterized protein LOC135133539 isoform X2 [Zophobas morio]|uniref:uncharacterized protein LOC135133539 isoform X2 n=1 Tax=Zophobas morio TaxID=2755281 RepID=UPI0030831459
MVISSRSLDDRRIFIARDSRRNSWDEAPVVPDEPAAPGTGHMAMMRMDVWRAVTTGVPAAGDLGLDGALVLRLSPIPGSTSK